MSVLIQLLLFLAAVLVDQQRQVFGFLPINIPSTTVRSRHDPSMHRLVSKERRILTGAIRRRTIPPRCDALPVERTDEEWKQLLTDEQYYVLRKEGTETPGASELNYIKEAGTFCCAGCGAPLFVTDDKFDSGTGWPSFTKPVSSSAISHSTDFKLIFPRTECSCSQCGGHLGHVFGGTCLFCRRGVFRGGKWRSCPKDCCMLLWLKHNRLSLASCRV